MTETLIGACPSCSTGLEHLSRRLRVMGPITADSRATLGQADAPGPLGSAFGSRS